MLFLSLPVWQNKKEGFLTFTFALTLVRSRLATSELQAFRLLSQQHHLPGLVKLVTALFGNSI